MKLAVRSASDLRRRLNLTDGFTKSTGLAKVDGRDGVPEESDFPVFVPLEFLRRIESGNPDDPLLRQVLPVPEENTVVPGFTADPVGEVAAGGESLATGVLRKYRGRALLVANQACGIHCRYCFRRHFPYQAAANDRHTWTEAIQQLAADKTLDEVILSGGDPLVLTDPALRNLVDAIAEIPHIQRLRVHSRMPIVIPQRVGDALIETLRGTRLSTWVVVHANHPAELDHDTGESLKRLIDHGIPVLNQAVLLRGVNDDVQTLENLCRRLVNLRVQPYYLHQLDRVAGAAHFEVDERRGREIVTKLRERLPGYAVPTYVREQADEPSKTPLL
jgi:EF-P beta-lysylation protein EpmB